MQMDLSEFHYWLEVYNRVKTKENENSNNQESS